MKLSFVSLLIALLIAINIEDIQSRRIRCYRERRITRSQSLTIYKYDSYFTYCTYLYIRNRENKVVSITLSNINVDCNQRNDIYIRSDNYRLNYCESQQNSISFTTQDSKIIIYDLGSVFFDINVDFDNANPVTQGPVIINPTNAPVTNAPVNNENCGVPSIAPNESGLRIVGGFDAIPHSWPWQVYITDGNYLCGATLIDRQWLVTAAHCRFNPSTFKAYLGDHYRGEGKTIIDVQQFIEHPNYQSNEEYDVALIKLRTPVTYSDTIKKACLPNNRQEQTGIVTGWGTTSYQGSVSNTLKQAAITIQPNSNCRSLRTPEVSVCAGQYNPNHDSCQGDSGGPFVMKDRTTNSFYLFGVVSSGIGCSGNGVYVRVSSVQTWITQTMAANN